MLGLGLGSDFVLHLEAGLDVGSLVGLGLGLGLGLYRIRVVVRFRVRVNVPGLLIGCSTCSDLS